MKNNKTYAAAAQREPRTFKTEPAAPARASNTQDLVATGFTRAQMRQMVIDQIG